MHNNAIAIAVLAASAISAAPASAQTISENEALAAAAERAAQEAENAAAAARQATLAAETAAKAARAAANSAKARLGASSAAPMAAARVETQPLPENENLAVTPPGSPVSLAATHAGQRVLSDALSASVANGPNGSSLKSSTTPDLQLLASSKDKVASLAWTLDISGQPRQGLLATDQLTFTASSKLDDSGEATILGLKGFTNGTELKLSYSHFQTRVNLRGIELDPVREARERCLASPPAEGPSACDPYSHKTGVTAFVDKYYRPGRRQLLDQVFSGPVWYYGVEASGNQANFRYLDRATFGLLSKRRFGYGATLFGGALVGRGATALTGSFSYQRRYSEQDPVTLCQPIAGTIQTQCVTSADGPPGRKTQAILALEARHAFPVGFGGANFAIAPEISADVENDAYSIDVPIYFTSDEAGKLRGGIRGVYLNEDGEDGREESFTLGLFVGVPFSLFDF